MDTRHASSWKTVDLFLVLASLFVLFPCLYYPYAATSPNLGFTISPSDWKVVSSQPCIHSPDTCLLVGDQILAIEQTRFEEFSHDRQMSVARLFGRDGVARVRLIRDGQTLVRDVRVRSWRVDRPQVLLSTIAPLIFWLMGTVVIIFLRPRDERWLVLVLFSYSIAIWIASGIGQRA